MKITYTLDNKIVFDKEINKKHITKFTIKISLVTIVIIGCSSLKVIAATPWYKQKLDEGGMYIYFKLFETVFADRVIDAIEALQDWPKEILQLIIDAGYTVEELISWYVENSL